MYDCDFDEWYQNAGQYYACEGMFQIEYYNQVPQFYMSLNAPSPLNYTITDVTSIGI